jgi:alkylated DNA repair dioxygenase AlkB
VIPREATPRRFATPAIVVRQLDLFAAPAVAFDAGFGSLRRHELAHGAWVDHQPGWVAGHDLLFDELERGLAWKSEKMKMYDRTVTVPRLLAGIARTGAGQPLLETMRLALSARYGEEFTRTTAALYRDGKDSVAWHGDTTARDMDQAIVATISLGQPRRFMLKPTEGGSSIAFPAGRGDLIVMGGTCQRTWRHGIPKVASAGPRIAVMFRPAWSKDY